MYCDWIGQPSPFNILNPRDRLRVIFSDEGYKDPESPVLQNGEIVH
jgi:hypothetical protein